MFCPVRQTIFQRTSIASRQSVTRQLNTHALRATGSHLIASHSTKVATSVAATSSSLRRAFKLSPHFGKTIPPSAPMESYSKYFPSSESDALVRLDFDGESRVWVLVFLGKDTPDNRLSHNFINNGLLPALDFVEQQWDTMVNNSQNDLGAALITTGGVDASAKIYSNGLDFEKAIADPKFFDQCLNALYEKLLTFPVPTIAAINGHGFAAGFGLACAHDYRVMNQKRGYLCMNEIDFGAPLPLGLQMTLASKIVDIITMRKIVLEGHRFSAVEAKDAGFVDLLADSPQGTLDAAKKLADSIKIKAKMNVYGANKEVIYAPYIKVLRAKHDDCEEELHTPRAKM